MGRELRHLKSAFLAALMCLPAACSASPAAEVDRPTLGLMGTIPIFWGEAGSVNELLAGEGSTHWARAELEASYRLEPLDTLAAENLADLDYLLLAQPRALSGAENVALDAWVRKGGRLLLFADPMLTGESKFPIGDRRRPQDVILLSPILGHWGLDLQYDPEQPGGYALLNSTGGSIPVNLRGSFEPMAGEGECRILAEKVLARCRVGKGRAVVLADAALLDLYHPHPAASRAFEWLVAESFQKSGK